MHNIFCDFVIFMTDDMIWFSISTLKSRFVRYDDQNCPTVHRRKKDDKSKV